MEHFKSAFKGLELRVAIKRKKIMHFYEGPAIRESGLTKWRLTRDCRLPRAFRRVLDAMTSKVY